HRINRTPSDLCRNVSGPEPATRTAYSGRAVEPPGGGCNPRVPIGFHSRGIRSLGPTLLSSSNPEENIRLGRSGKPFLLGAGVGLGLVILVVTGLYVGFQMGRNSAAPSAAA